ncbi:PAS domain-containing sensor histidine kinase [Zoogloea sp.]|uniref:sensor histidine kinase n=1 Tax=Zoogloea sp. TaxID=49181 RepID=UPI00262557FD|nr:PAS domain-containing sensor histidine kinase [Zoogloea sp.]MDD3353374.1 PAS domain-containing sensor histidine kinase [Zoogloea sp.]
MKTARFGPSAAEWLLMTGAGMLLAALAAADGWLWWMDQLLYDAALMARHESAILSIEGARPGSVVIFLPSWVGAGIAAFLVAGLMLALVHLSARAGLVASLGLGAGVVLVAVVGLHAGGWWFGPAPALMASVLAYPLWSWRRLEAVQCYLDAECRALEQDAAALGLPFHGRCPILVDAYAQRIHLVRRGAQRQRDMRRFIADTLEHLPIGVLVIDPSDRIVLHNAQSRRLLQASEGQDLLAALRNLPWPAHLPLRDGLPDSSGEAAVSQLKLTPDGPSHLLVSVASLSPEPHCRSGWVIGLADVTGMHEAQRGREDTMHFLSHDLRAPLASILTLIDAYQDDPARQSAQIPRISRYARSALDLADGLFRLVRAEGVDPKDFVELDLAGLVDSAADEVWPQANARSIRLLVDTRDAEREESIVRGDFSLLRRAVINLLTNGIKYGKAGTALTLILNAEGPDWVIRVRDQGEGIPPEALPRLFQRFSRVAGEGPDHPAGVGLGLVIVKTVAERHGGSVAVDSTQGEGSTFTLRLPLRSLSAGQQATL